ncbi:MAG: DNA polymerase III subunit gamma/tau [Clostridiales Family XIII bacterium]|nr:DNA polymerase III subunit gamma/tau [Clostridiales Family XIII bacterium]
MYLALYRRFRPETFDRVLGQEHIVKILTNQLRGGTVGHAYLFCGTRGTGKTTMARLLAKGVNCLSDGERPCGLCAHCAAIRDGIFVDVIEIDAASNNGVENIRELRESVKYPPSVGRRKVYIVDEVHMLSAGAFNALLKTLEEPPENVMFVLATTERQKLPATILSRCLRLDFRRVPAETLKRGMRDICAALGVGVTEEALSLLASNADGSVRDGLSLLDQCVSGGAGEVTRDTVLELLGSPGEEQLAALTDLVFDGDVSGALLRLDRLLAEGRDERQLMKDWIEHFRNLMLLGHLKRPEDILNMSAENIEILREQSERLPSAFVNDSIFALAETLNDARRSTQFRILLEVGIIRMATREASGVSAAAPRPAPAQMPKEAAPESVPAPRPAPPAESPALRPVAQESMPAEGPESPAPKPAPPPPADELAPPAPVLKTLDWPAVIAAAARQNAMLTRLKNRSGLAEIKEKSFTVELSDGITKQVAEDGREQIEAAAAKIAGRPLRMDCVLGEGVPAPQSRAPSARAEREDGPEPEADIPHEETQIQETFNFGQSQN